MIIWLDDERDPADFSSRTGWVWVTNAPDAINMLTAFAGEVEYLSLDHDLGEHGCGTGYDVTVWLEEQAAKGNLNCIPGDINIHSANPVGRANMEAAIRSIERFVR